MREDNACKLCYSASRDKQDNYSGWCSTNKNGCGCPNNSKTRVTDEVCPNKIWGNDWVNTDRLKEYNEENNFTPKEGYKETI